MKNVRQSIQNKFKSEAFGPVRTIFSASVEITAIAIIAVSIKMIFASLVTVTGHFWLLSALELSHEVYIAAWVLVLIICGLKNVSRLIRTDDKTERVEQRSHVRHPVNKDIQLALHYNTMCCKTINMSEGGLCVNTI